MGAGRIRAASEPDRTACILSKRCCLWQDERGKWQPTNAKIMQGGVYLYATVLCEAEMEVAVLALVPWVSAFTPFLKIASPWIPAVAVVVPAAADTSAMGTATAARTGLRGFAVGNAVKAKWPHGGLWYEGSAHCVQEDRTLTALFP